jgi:hypothetical protein
MGKLASLQPSNNAAKPKTKRLTIEFNIQETLKIEMKIKLELTVKQKPFLCNID